MISHILGVAKGIAVIILLIHHLTYTFFQIPVIDSEHLITVLTKVCVPIFTILSGYGMTKSYKNKSEDMSNFKFIYIHIKKVLINYWWIYVPVFILSFFMHIEGTPLTIYGSGITGIKNGLLDFLGLKTLFNTPTLNTTWWYLEIILVYYCIFPLLYKCIRKNLYITLIISLIPCIVACITHYTSTDREIFYLFPFLIGILFAEKDYLDNVVVYCNNQKLFFAIISMIFMFTWGFLSTKIPLIPNVFFAIFIIAFTIFLKSNKIILNKCLELLGKNSMNIFLIHSFIYYYFITTRNIIYSIPNVFLRYMVLLLSSLLISIVIEQCKEIIKNVLNKFHKREEKI